MVSLLQEHVQLVGYTDLVQYAKLREAGKP